MAIFANCRGLRETESYVTFLADFAEALLGVA
jgi:hypothetical protein